MIHHHTIEIAATTYASMKMLLLLLLTPSKDLSSAKNKEEVNKILKRYGVEKELTSDMSEIINWVSIDNFANNEKVTNNPRNFMYLNKLNKIKTEFFDFYFESLSTLVNTKSDIATVSQVHDKIGKYCIQIMRLRLLINPEVQLSRNVHTSTKIEYLAAKAFWIDDSGKKVRKFTKSMGRFEEYPGGIKSKKAMDEAIIKLQEQIYIVYRSIYE
jgi:hypothetical protein